MVLYVTWHLFSERLNTIKLMCIISVILLDVLIVILICQNGSGGNGGGGGGYGDGKERKREDEAVNLP